MTLARDPEKARAWRLRSKRIKRQSDKRATNASERFHVRGTVFARDGWRCRMAHVGGCYGFLTPHHILKASQGGEYTEGNLVTLCAHHNGLIESDADFAALARELGFVRYWWEGRQVSARTCSADGCAKPVQARGKCVMHYHRDYRARLKADAEASAAAVTAQLQERVTYETHPCPECGRPMIGARVFDPKAKEAFVGAVCVQDDAAYRIVWSAA